MKQLARLFSNALPAYCLLAIIYVGLILVLPANKTTLATHNISANDYKIILLALALPSLAIWLAAFIGYLKLQQYAESIRKTPEGSAFAQLARGCVWLAWSLPISAIIYLFLNGLANQWPSFLPTAIILSNYVYLVMPLIAFSIIGAASRELVSGAKLKFSHSSSQAIMVLFALAGVFYCYLIFRQFDLSGLGTTNNPYFLPIWLTVLTIIVPYLYTWFVGFLAAYEISLYSRNVPGVLYRRALYLVVGGLIAVIASSIALQYLNGINPPAGLLVLDYQLALNIAFRILGGAGFVLIAIGAIRLKKIEEI